MSFDLSTLVVAFLGGGGLTAIGFMASYSTRLTKVEGKLSGVVTTLTEVKNAVHQTPCPASQVLNTKVAVLTARVDDIDETVKDKISNPFRHGPTGGTEEAAR